MSKILSNLMIKTNSSSYAYYESHSTFHEGDAGLDLFVLEDIQIKAGEVKFVDFGISCQMVEEDKDGTKKHVSYFLYPRSSISKTPLILANSVGIIDSAYTGSIIAALRNVGVVDYTLKAGQRLVQICARNLEPFKTEIVEELRKTSRGNGGFGSTGL